MSYLTWIPALKRCPAHPSVGPEWEPPGAALTSTSAPPIIFVTVAAFDTKWGFNSDKCVAPPPLICQHTLWITAELLSAVDCGASRPRLQLNQFLGRNKIPAEYISVI